MIIHLVHHSQKCILKIGQAAEQGHARHLLVTDEPLTEQTGKEKIAFCSMVRLSRGFVLLDILTASPSMFFTFFTAASWLQLLKGM